MVYFLPQSFQKRILRFALGRLDFIESQTLDLDNLGISIGQRSVVELKNVAIDVKKLAARVPLPPIIVVTRAAIRTLRVIVPADLHLSGIQVEVDGVDIKAEVKEIESKQLPNRGSHSAPRNRRTGSTGEKYEGRDLSASHILPTPGNLAQSFLLEEPESERRELRHAVQSQSGLLGRASSDGSSSSVSSDQAEGQAEGFSPPGFVANFFSGVADRLSVKIGDVEISASVLTGDDPTSPPLEMILRLKEVNLAPIQSTPDLEAAIDSRRAISIDGIEIFFAGDFNNFARRSTKSSPMTSREPSNMAPSTAQRFDVQSSLSSSLAALQDSSVFPQQHSSESIFGNSRGEQSLLQGKALRRPSSDAASNISDDDLAYGEDNSQDEDLTESRFYSHDEAQSMYMSAISGHAGERTVTADDADTFAESQSFLKHDTISNARSPTVKSHVPSDQETYTDLDIPRSAKRVCTLSSLKLKIPNLIAEQTGGLTAESDASVPPKSSHGNSIGYSKHMLNVSDMSYHDPAGLAITDLSSESSFDIDAGILTVEMDMNLCYGVLQGVSHIARILGQSNILSTPAPDIQASLLVTISFERLSVYLQEDVPSLELIQVQPLSSLNEQHLLCFDALRINIQHKGRGSQVEQSFQIQKLSLSRQNDGILLFSDNTAVQESFIATTVLIEPNDVVITRTNNRMKIAVKPIYLNLDLLLMDNVLSKSGGLSSFLDLATSITSSSTMNDRNPAGRPRSVRFSEPKAHFSSHNANNNSLKIDARISGIVVDVVGSGAALQAKTSSIKIAYRTAGVKANISSISIRGPSSGSQTYNKSMSIRLNQFQFIYLNSPEEEDLDRLLGLITPSNDKFGDDDDIMVDTLLRQRRQGTVGRLSIDHTNISVNGLEWLNRVSTLSEDVARLSSISKYLPEDDRPGMLIFGLLKNVDVSISLDNTTPTVLLDLKLIEGAQISVPSLMAGQVSAIDLKLDKVVVLRELVPDMQASRILGPPMLMARFIADEMEPTVKLKISNVCTEYSVSSLLKLQSIIDIARLQIPQSTIISSPRASQISSTASEVSEFSRRIKLSIALRSVAALLKPLDVPSAGLIVLTDASFNYKARSSSTDVLFNANKATLLLIDDCVKIGSEAAAIDPKLYFDQNDHIQALAESGFVPVGSLSAASVEVRIAPNKHTQQQHIDVEVRANLFFLETCADSTQTLFQVLGGLSPPAAPAKVAKYRVEQRNIIPIEDLLASFSGNAFVSEQGPQLGMPVQSIRQVPPTKQHVPDTLEDDDDDEIDDEEKEEEDDNDDEAFLNDLYQSQAEESAIYDFVNSSIGSLSEEPSRLTLIAPVNTTADANIDEGVLTHSMLDFRNDYFGERDTVGGTAHRWQVKQNTYSLDDRAQVEQSPVNVRIRDVHFIWNLFDGYDWQNTREVISQAVRELEEKVMVKKARRGNRRSPMPEEEDESVVGDMLFNSIYISIPTHKNAQDLAQDINIQLGDNASETGSYATSTTITAATSKKQLTRKPKKLHLNRSKQHKMTFELDGLSVDFIMLPSGTSDVESSVDVRVRKLEIFDHVPTSTWKKFATYMHEAGELETGSDMIHLELLNVKPVAELSASEIVMKLTVLPLRLHVDQDALDFLTRFFEFKDDRLPPPATPSTPPFIQRAEVNPIKLRLDFKPKRVNYAALRSGHTSEFMNFIILDRADIMLRRIILYGVSGFDRLGIMLNNIWTPDVTKNQLPTVLAGLAPIRSLVDVGLGMKELVAVPIREYKKDGRVVRAVQKGALAFAKTTTTELVNLGAKLAIGTQTVLQNAEEVLAPQKSLSQTDEDGEQPRNISLYADQPVGIIAGLRGAYASLERDLLLAKDAIVAVPGEIMAEGSAAGAAKVMIKQSPTIILRPAIGVTKAVGQALLGAGNTLDKGKRKRTEDKYKRY